MDKFLFVLRVPQDYEPGVQSNIEALNAWFQSIGPGVVDRGRMVVEASSLGETSDRTRVGGYLFVNTEDRDAALAVAKECPFVLLGGGIEVGLVLDGPPPSLRG